MQRILRHGDPARVIADYASKRRVGLIMMPTRGVGRFRKFLLGSVASKVLRYSILLCVLSAVSPRPNPIHV